MLEKKEIYEKFLYTGFIERFRVDPENAHLAVIRLLHIIQHSPALIRVVGKLILSEGKFPTSDRLHASIAGMEVKNPLMLPAGFDKQGQAFTALLRVIGMGFVEIGTVPPKPQPGNERPRIFRLGDEVVLNRMGFNSDGAEKVNNRIVASRGILHRDEPIGVSLGMNKDTPFDEAPRAHAEAARILGEGSDFLTINASSPNTKNLRKLLTQEHMMAIITEVKTALSTLGIERPIFLKLSPDPLDANSSWQEQINTLIQVAEEVGVAGFMLTNTTINEKQKEYYGVREQMGGLSGRPLRERSNEMITYLNQHTRLPIIGMGGVGTGSDDEDRLMSVLEKFAAGADAVGMYTAMIFHGPSYPSYLLHKLDKWMQQEGVKNIGELVGNSYILKRRTI